VHHVGILYDQFMMHGQRNIKFRVISTYDHVKWNAGEGGLKVWDVAGNMLIRRPDRHQRMLI